MEVKCNKCERLLDQDTFFYKNKTRKSGYNATCKSCSNEVRRKRVAKLKAEKPRTDGGIEQYARLNAKRPSYDDDGMYIPSPIPQGEDSVNKVQNT